MPRLFVLLEIAMLQTAAFIVELTDEYASYEEVDMVRSCMKTPVHHLYFIYSGVGAEIRCFNLYVLGAIFVFCASSTTQLIAMRLLN